MLKNTASQKAYFFAYTPADGLPKTGDAGNITAYVDIDYGGVTVLGDTSASERDSTNAKGVYIFDLTQGETNGNTLMFSAKSSTGGVVVVGMPAIVFTDPVGGVASPTNITAAAGCAVSSIGNDVITPAAIAAATGLKPLLSGTASSGSTTTIALVGGVATDNYYRGRMVVSTGGTGPWQAAFISAYDGTTKIATLRNAVATAFDNTTTFAVLPWCPVDVYSFNTVAQTAGDAVALAVAIKAVTDLLPNAGALTSLATAAALATTDGKVDLIKVKTDNLPSDPADASDILSATNAIAALVAATAIRSALGLASANLDTQLAAIQADSPNRLTKNTALSAFMFLMLDSADHVTPKTGLTITATRSLDGAAFGACANSASEVGSGIYKINLDATDTNANVVVFKFTSSGADPRYILALTQPT